MKLQSAWNARAKLRAEGDKLWAEGDKLRAEGDELWAEAVLAAHGNVTIEWRWNTEISQRDCVLGNGDRYTAEMAGETNGEA